MMNQPQDIMRMLCSFRRRRATTFLSLLGALALATSAGATVIIEPFDSPDGGLPDDWVMTGNGIGQIAEFALGDYRLRQGEAGNNYIYYTGSQGDVVGGQISNFSGSVVFNTNSNNQARGIVLRSQTTTYGSQESYMVSIKTGAGAPILGIWLNPADTTIIEQNGQWLLNSTPWSSPGTLATNTNHLLTFSAIGDELSAAVYDWNVGTAAYDILRGTVSYTIGTNVHDTPENGQYSSGYFGFRNMLGSAGRVTYWNDLEITVVPEPSSLGLLGAALGVLIWRRRRATS